MPIFKTKNSMKTDIIIDLIVAVAVTSYWIYLGYKTNLKLNSIQKIWDNQTQQYNLLLAFQMKVLMNDAIKEENYELAKQCQGIIEKIGDVSKIAIEITEIKK